MNDYDITLVIELRQSQHCHNNVGCFLKQAVITI